MEIIGKFLTLPVALGIGSAIGFVINHLISLHTSKKEREHKRLELLISFLQSELIRLDERLDKIINANFATVGVAIGQETFTPEDQSHTKIFTERTFEISKKQNINELNHLDFLCDTYKITGTVKNSIEEIRKKIEQQCIESSGSQLLSDSVTLLMDIQLQFRLLIHVLSEKLLSKIKNGALSATKGEQDSSCYTIDIKST